MVKYRRGGQAVAVDLVLITCTRKTARDRGRDSKIGTERKKPMRARYS